jgi:hypothetical protein
MRSFPDIDGTLAAEADALCADDGSARREWAEKDGI